mmetsp:Transcript_2838/g.4415  ORF Transcript_2838/g.4415 Transcript_2838/m.4415 type:complete len:205 (+) Transcript_2838:492-1106(+)
MVVPSTNGNRSRCTPSALASADFELKSLLEQILSISSMNTIPDSSAALIASFFRSTFSNIFSISISRMTSRASEMGIFFFSMPGRPPRLPPPAAPSFFNMSPMACADMLLESVPKASTAPSPSFPPPAAPKFSGTSISSSWFSKSPSSSMPRNDSRCPFVPENSGPTRMSNIRSSTISLASSRNFSICRFFVSAMLTSIKSRTI